MRLFTITQAVPKYCSADTTIGQYKIPGDSLLLLHFGNLHNDPKYWTDPEEFKPERFDTRVSPPINPDSYHPFSGGVRVCIGQYFSMIEQVTILSMLVREYEFSVPVGITREKLFESTFLIALKPMHGMNLIVRKRQH